MVLPFIPRIYLLYTIFPCPNKPRADADLQPGDILQTSGLDSVYPQGIPVARVDQAARAAGTPYYRVTLSPLAAFRSSKYVLTLPQTAAQPATPPASAAP